MSQLMYYYSYGSEDILNSTITVTKIKNEVYEIILVQESLEPNFDKLETDHKIVTKDSHIDFINVNENLLMYKNTTNMIVKAINNPSPEKLFRINEIN